MKCKRCGTQLSEQLDDGVPFFECPMGCEDSCFIPSVEYEEN